MTVHLIGSACAFGLTHPWDAGRMDGADEAVRRVSAYAGARLNISERGYAAERA